MLLRARQDTVKHTVNQLPDHTGTALTRIRLYTLGELRLEGIAVPLSSRRKTLALLAYLAARAPRAVPRAELATLFWGESNDERARHSLRQALVQLKHSIGESFALVGESVAFRRDAVEVDAALFEHEVAAGQYEAAVARWRGDYLVGTEEVGTDDYRAWLEAERERLRRRLAYALERLTSDAEYRGAWAEAVELATRWTELLPFDERAHLHLLDGLRLQGDVGGALARHASMVARFVAELGREPSAELVRVGRTLEAAARNEAHARYRRLGALPVPDMTGRSTAFACLTAAWQDVANHSPAVVVVEGDTGIGKSRLCEEFLRWATDQLPRPMVLRANGRAAGERAPWDAARELLAGLQEAPALGGTSPEALAELSGLVPSLRTRFPRLREPSGDSRSLAEAVSEALTVLAEESPLILFADDLSRSDDMSRHLIVSLASHLPAETLLLITLRAEEGDDNLTDLSTVHGFSRLKLQPLNVAEVEFLLGSILQFSDGERHAVALRLHAETGGKPSYLTDLIAALVDEGCIRLDADDVWRWDSARTRMPLPLPGKLREVIRNRLSTLSESARVTAEAAAVLGSRFDSQLIHAMTGISRETIVASLDELLACHIVRVTGSQPDTFEFTDQLTCRVASALAPAERRMVLRRAASEALAPAMAPRSKRRWIRAVAIAALPLAVAAGLGLRARRQPGPDPHRVAVSVFENRTGDSALDPIGSMTTEWITQGLLQIGLVEVVEAASGADRSTIARQTRAGALISGNYYMQHDSLAFQAEIVDPAGEILRAIAPVTAPTTAPLAAVAVLRQRIMASLAMLLNPRERSTAEAVGEPPTFEAYQEYAAGMEYYVTQQWAAAASHFDSAARFDTTFYMAAISAMRAHNALGESAAFDSIARTLDRARTRLLPYERASLDRALAEAGPDLAAQYRTAKELVALVPGSDDAVNAMAIAALQLNRPAEATRLFEQLDPNKGVLKDWTYYWWALTSAYHLAGDYRGELDAARRGIQQYPDAIAVRANEARALAALGRTDELKERLEASLTLPVTPGFNSGGLMTLAAVELLRHGRPREEHEILALSIAWYKARALDNRNLRFEFAYTLYLAGRYAEARALFEGLLEDEPESAFYRSFVGVTAARMGDRPTAEKISAWLEKTQPAVDFGEFAFRRARIMALLGHRDRAVELAREALARGWGNTLQLHEEPDFEPLRNYSPFRELTEPKG